MELSKSAAIITAILYVWSTVFLFPMIHDLYHELGHAAYYISGCGYKSAAISLGEYLDCPIDYTKSITYCVYPGWFYKSLYRQSMAFANPFEYPAETCNQTTVSAMGGVFGILFSYITLAVISFSVWRFSTGESWKQSALVGITFLFTPLMWLEQRQFPRHLIWLQILFGFGAILLQFDVINDFFYSFWPSRLVILIYLPLGDGSQVWRSSGIDEYVIFGVSFLVWLMLVVIYGFIFNAFYRYVRRLQARKIAPSEVSDLP